MSRNYFFASILLNYVEKLTKGCYFDLSVGIGTHILPDRWTSRDGETPETQSDRVFSRFFLKETVGGICSGKVHPSSVIGYAEIFPPVRLLRRIIRALYSVVFASFGRHLARNPIRCSVSLSKDAVLGYWNFICIWNHIGCDSIWE